MSQLTTKMTDKNNSTTATAINFGKKACTFLDASPDPFHAVQESCTKLASAGFQKLSKREPFTGKLQPGGRYMYTINKSALVAFSVGHKYEKGNGFKVIGGHTDSPNLKVKPCSKRNSNGTASAGKCLQLAVECYGGGLWHTWFDRDLGISGRVLVRDKGESSMITQRLVKIDKPVARVSTLCIHLQTGDERAAFKINKEDHMSPIIATLESETKSQLMGSEGSDDKKDRWAASQEPRLMNLVAEQLGIDVSQIADFELNLFDTQPAAIGGVHDEFLYSARLDNLATCFVSVEALIAHSTDNLESDTDINVVVLFDHEEVGSGSAAGAGSPIMAEAINRIETALNGGIVDPDLHASTVRKSFILSVDQAHAVHPNYASKHERNHQPLMNGGVVMKSNSNQRYTTNGVTGFVVRELTRIADIAPVQEFVVRNDCPCGSTIGPIISAKTGIRTVDAGMPQLSMHSCREVMGVQDLSNGFDLFKAFFEHFRSVDNNLEG